MSKRSPKRNLGAKKPAALGRNDPRRFKRKPTDLPRLSDDDFSAVLKANVTGSHFYKAPPAPPEEKIKILRQIKYDALDWMMIVANGIAKQLKQTYSPCKMRSLIKIINLNLDAAVKSAEEASNAYEPYSTLRRLAKRRRRAGRNL